MLALVAIVATAVVIVMRSPPTSATRSCRSMPLPGQRQRRDRHVRQQRADLPGVERRLRRRAATARSPARTSSNNAYDMVNLDVDGDAVDVQLVELAGHPARRGDGAVRRAVLGCPPHRRHRRDDDDRRRSTRCRCGCPGTTDYQTITASATFGPTVGDDGLPAVRRRDGARAGGRSRRVLGRQRRRRHGRGPLRRLVAGRRLPRPDAAAAQPHRLRRVLRRRRQQLGDDHDLRLPRPAGRARSTPGSAWSPTRATRARPVTRRSSTAPGWRRRCRRAPTSSTAPTTSTARNVTTRHPADVNMLGFDIKHLGVPGAIPNERDVGHRHASARRASATSSASSRRRSTSTPRTSRRAEDGHQPRRPRSRRRRRRPRVHADVHQHGTGPGAEQRRRPTRCPPNTTFVPGSIEILTGPNAGVKTDGAGDDQAEYLAACRTVRVRLGTGATGDGGGVDRARRDHVGALPGRRRCRRAGHDARQPGQPRLRRPDDRQPVHVRRQPDRERRWPPNADLRDHQDDHARSGRRPAPTSRRRSRSPTTAPTRPSASSSPTRSRTASCHGRHAGPAGTCGIVGQEVQLQPRRAWPAVRR